MSKKVLMIECPKNLNADFEAYNFLSRAQYMIQKSEVSIIEWNMSQTKIFDTNLLAMIYFIFRKADELNKKVYVVMPNNDLHIGMQSRIPIFNYYARDKRSFFKPRIIGEGKNRETEDVLLKYLKKLRLEKYDIVKTLISELFANIKMHTNEQSGFIEVHMMKKKIELLFQLQMRNIQLQSNLN